VEAAGIEPAQRFNRDVKPSFVGSRINARLRECVGIVVEFRFWAPSAYALVAAGFVVEVLESVDSPATMQKYPRTRHLRR
jgi:hypothetical protein